jgi:holo-[acyl-carrier protein] synthase
MIVGLGIDLVSVSRFRGFQERRGDHGLTRLFTDQEIEYCLTQHEAAPSLAARFAAKEAFFKAVRTGFGVGGRWLDLEVLRDEAGAPRLSVSGRALEVLQEVGGRQTHLTLTHTRETAAAVVVVEG